MAWKPKAGHHLDGDPTDADKARFNKFVKVNRTTGCHEWTGYKCKKGYGQFWWRGRSHWAHRISYAWRHGKVPQRMEVNHMDCCLNPGCVNADEHLDLKSKKKNSSEANTRRGFRGNQHTKREAA